MVGALPKNKNINVNKNNKKAIPTSGMAFLRENMNVEEKLVYYQKREQELLASLEFYDKVHAMQARKLESTRCKFRD